MASLRDTITKSIGTGGKQLVRNTLGQLVEQAVPISQLAGQQGMTAPPTTPGGATAIGATPDSAKMAGTPNQMQSALRQNTDQINTTQEAQADKRYRSTLTAEEQKRKEDTAKLAPLSETQAKVQSYVDTEIAKLSSGPTGYDVWKQGGVDATSAADAKFAADTAAYNDQVAKAEETRKTNQTNVNNILAEYTKFRSGIQSDASEEQWASAGGMNKLLTDLQNNGLSAVEAQSLLNQASQAGRASSPPPTWTAPPVNIGPAPTKQAGVAPVLPSGMNLVNPFIPTDPAQKGALDAAWADMSSPDPQKRIAAVQTIGALTEKDSTAINVEIDNSIAKSSATGLGSQVASQVGNTSVGDLLPSLGISEGDLSAALGMTPEQVKGLTLDELSAAVSNMGGTTTQTDEAASSALLGSAERAEMAERSKELSTSGAAAIDDQLMDLGTQLESADEITFLGKTGTLSELLSDEGISNEVTALLNDKERFDKLPDTDPLKQFITRYQDVLKQAGTTLKGTVAESDQITKTNQEATILGGIQLAPEVVSALLGDISKTSAVDINKSPLLSWAKQQSPEQQALVAQALAANPTLATELNKLSRNELIQLGVGSDSPRWKTFIKAAERKKALDAIAPDDIDGLLSFMFAGSMNTTTAQQLLSENANLAKLGLPSHGGLDALDSDKDGRVDSPDQLRKAASTLTTGGSLREVLDGSTLAAPKAVQPAPPMDSASQQVLSLFSRDASPGAIVSKLLSGELPFDVAKAVADRPAGSLPKSLRDAIPIAVEKNTRKKIGDWVLAKAHGGINATNTSKFNVLNDLLRGEESNNPLFDRKQLQKTINDYAKWAEGDILKKKSYTQESVDFMRRHGYLYTLVGGKPAYIKKK